MGGTDTVILAGQPAGLKQDAFFFRLRAGNGPRRVWGVRLDRA